MDEIFIRNDDQRAILDSVRRFVEAEVEPRAAELDAKTDPEEAFSWEIVEAADAFGLRTMTLSEEQGGMGVDSTTTAMVVEELARGDIGISVVFAQTLKIAAIMEKAFNEDQIQRSLVPFVEDPRAVLSICITEPDSGSNGVLPHATPLKTRAVKVDGGWVANGMKHFISNSNRSRFFMVFMQTDPSKSMMGGVLFHA
jgi:alkylation response protein AidB-like acyl-CoA dehydrogenase